MHERERDGAGSMRDSADRAGQFVISLDFELYWGMRDRWPIDRVRERLLGARQAVPALLDTFTAFGVRATWATVGMLFFRTRQELLAGFPAIEPAYLDGRLSPYLDLSLVGENEADDPLHFAPSLIAQIARAPGQEVATHTFSHFYCLEAGQDEAAFRADLEAAKRAAETFGIGLRSIVFPRNQFNPAYLPACVQAGIVAYRGNAVSRLYRERPKGAETRGRRALRLLDAYVPIAGNSSADIVRERPDWPVNVPASRFLRPYLTAAKPLEWLRAERICRDMTRAALSGRLFHLWWHPHNFGDHLAENLAILRRILRHANRLHNHYGFRFLTMAEAAQLAPSPPIADSQASHEAA